jgi:hypothetical protein
MVIFTIPCFIYEHIILLVVIILLAYYTPLK